MGWAWLQLGDGTNIDRTSPPSFDVLSGVASVAAGYSFTCVVMISAGGVRCWGRNNIYQVNMDTPFFFSCADVLAAHELFAFPGLSDVTVNCDSASFETVRQP
jgi:hypothetical protein